MQTKLLFLLSMALIIGLFSTATHALQINEIRIDQTGGDTDEYFELAGNAGESLDDHTYLVIGDGGAGASGVIESVVNLDGQLLDSNGLFTVAESSFSLAVANLTTELNFENSDNVTHLLVTGFTGTNSDDLDIDDDGVLDTLPWDRVVDSVALKENDTGELLYSPTVVGPDFTFVPAHIYHCEDGFEIGVINLADPAASDTPTAVNNCSVDPRVQVLSIPEIQSNLAASPFDGQRVQTSGVVIGDFQGDDQLRGFFIQDPAGDGDISTSDGVFVFNPGGIDVAVGDQVELVAEVDEFFGLTELKNITSLTITGTGSITPTAVSLPETMDGELERVEGMLVHIISEMTVTQNFFLARYGQLTLSSPDDTGMPSRLFQPTNVFSAGSTEAISLAASNARRTLILDDGQDVSGFGDNPNPVPLIGNPPSVLRSGDRVSNLIGVLDYGRINSSSRPARDYRLHPTVEPTVTPLNIREAIPAATGGQLSVASFNVLNYFSTLDGNGSVCGPLANQGCRGADTASELARQQAKLVNAIAAMNADIIGLIEIENNGHGPNSAIQTLVNAVNAALGDEVYAIASIADTPLGSDAIAVGFIYKSGTVVPVGTAATLTTGAFNQNLSDGGRSRQPLAVSFEELANAEHFTAVINHFKSKRAPATAQNNGNDDQGDGQGAWNQRRVAAANDLANWLATNPTGIADPDVLILGDLNAYAEEDPMLALQAQGYVDLIQHFNGDDQYSYTFDGLAGHLDHALANPSLKEQVSGVVDWHINTDEPPVIDYNENFNPAGYYSEEPFRSSDHDPVIVGLNLFTEAVLIDQDGDGVTDASDLCPDTPGDSKVNADGCSARQLIVLNCEQHYPQKPLRYLRCVFRHAHIAYRQGLINRWETRRIYWKAVFRVYFGRP